MKSSLKSRENFIVITIILTFAILTVMFLFLSLFINYEDGVVNRHRNIGKIISIEDDVLMKSSDGREFVTNLPTKQDSAYSYTYSFVPESVGNEKQTFIYIKGSYQIFDITYKNKLVYKHDKMDTSFLSSGGDYIRVVLIPKEYIGKKLDITFTALKDSDYGLLIQPLKMGSQEDLIYYTYQEDSDVIFIMVFLIVFALEAFIVQIALFFFRKSHARSFLVPLFALILGIYIIVRSPVFYFLFPKGPFIYVLDYLLFLFLPISVGVFILVVVKRSKKSKLIHKVLEFILGLLIINIIVQIIFTYTGYIEFMEIQKFLQIAVVLGALLTISMPFTIEMFAYKRLMSIAMALLMIVLIVFLGIYLTTYRIRYMVILGSVGSILIIFQSLIVMKLYADKYALAYRVRLNKSLAFTDNLTRISNRNAFENDIKNLKRNGKNIMFMIIDINNLKEINDRFGHNTGDFIIKSVAEILNKLQSVFTKTKSYRIGGDEFLLTAYDVNYNYVNKVIDYLDEKAMEFKNKKYNIPFDFAMGYEVARLDEEFDIDEFIKKVDKNMYEDKKKRKRDFSFKS